MDWFTNSKQGEAKKLISLLGDAAKRNAAAQDLIKLVHGSSKGIDKLVEEFKARHAESPLSKLSIVNKIKQVAVKEKRMAQKLTWFVKDEFLEGIDFSAAPATLPETTMLPVTAPPTLLNMTTPNEK